MRSKRNEVRIEVRSWLRVPTCFVALVPPHDKPMLGEIRIPFIYDLAMPATILSCFACCEALPVNRVTNPQIAVDMTLATRT